LFDFSDEDIFKLTEIFAPNTVKNPYRYPLAKVVKDALAIEGLDFISWRYIKSDEAKNPKHP